MSEKKVVLIVSSDLGFMCWLGVTLGAAGLEALPAKNVQDAQQLIRDFQLQIDALVIDPFLEGAESLTKALRHRPHHARTIALAAKDKCVAASRKSAAAPLYDLKKVPPGRSDPKAAADWVHTVESLLTATLQETRSA